MKIDPQPVAADKPARVDEIMQHLSAIVEYSHDAILSKDLNGVITSWNSGARRLFGYDAEEAIGQSITILIPDDRQDEEHGILQRLRAGELTDHYETVRRRKDGSLVNVYLREVKRVPRLTPAEETGLIEEFRAARAAGQRQGAGEAPGNDSLVAGTGSAKSDRSASIAG